MPLYVNENDHKLENLSLRYFCSKTDIFDGVKWSQNKDSRSTWDFTGKSNETEFQLDVKVRDINSNDYPDYFISEEKHDDSLERPCFVLYVFRGDRKMRLYDLSSCEFVKEDNQTIHHRRANKKMTSVVYKIPSYQSVSDVLIPMKG